MGNDGRQLQRIHKFDGQLTTAFQAERDHTARAIRHILLRQFVVFVARQTAIVYPCHLVVLRKIFGYLLCIATVLRHAQMQRLQAQIQQESVLRTLNTAQVTHQLRGCLCHISALAESLGIGQSVIRFIRCAESRELVRMGFPIEVSAVYDAAAYTGGMPVHVFSSGVNHDIGSPLKRTTVDRCRKCIINNQRHTVTMGNTGEFLNVEHFK